MRTWDKERLGTWLIILVLTIALLIGYVEFRSLVTCVNESQASVRARATATEKSDNAVDIMIERVLEGETPEERLSGLTEYRRIRAEVKKTRAENPVPAPEHC